MPVQGALVCPAGHLICPKLHPPAVISRHACHAAGTHPLVHRETQLALALEPVCLHQPVAVGHLAVLNPACMHHAVPIKPGTMRVSMTAAPLQRIGNVVYKVKVG